MPSRILPTLEYMLNTQVEPNEVTTLSQLVISVVRDALNAFPNHPDTSQKLLNGVQVAMTEATASSPSHELATIQLLEIFTVCLTSEEAGSSAEAVNIFRRLLSILGEPATPRRSRLVILQYVLRLRATASHRVTLVHDIDITGLAEALGRSQPIPTPRPAKLNEDPVVPKDEENERSSSRRGRCPQANDPPDRQESRSKSRIRFKDRNASLQPRVPRDPIWYIPEDVPFSTPIESAEGTEHLVSFDHTLEWSDSEDDREDDNFNSYDSALADRPSNAPTLLPVSEYIFTLKRIIQEDSDWDLVAYILCHLPVQLSCKHFFAGPRASRQLKLFRNLLVEGLMSSNFAAQTLLPEGNRRADLPSLAYHTLATLVAYKSLFSKLEQDEMVQTFATGLTQREVAKPCIHALAMACHELKPSMTKHLSQILSNLLKIMSSARMAVHILELIASISHLPSLFSSFTTDDYRTVLGIALQYITLHNDKTSLRHPNPDSTEESTKAEELAFHQYVFHLAYIVIEQWYMRMKLSQRRQQVPFIIRKLLQANEFRGRLDEASQVCVDMLARYATCDLDSRPRPSQLQGLLSSSKASQSCSRTWLQGHAVITITCLPTARWAEVTVRRPSGVAQLLMEVGNAPEACTTAVSADMLETLLSQRADILSSAPTDLSQRLGDLTADRVLTLERIKEVLGAVDWQRPSGKDLVQDQKDDSTQGGPASAATPSFFTLQLSSYPEFGNAGPPLLLPHEDRYQRTVRNLDSVPVVDFHKIGIVYVGQDDLTECDILSNTHGSKGYVRLLADLGQIVRLQGNDDYYLGGLDRENDLDGKWTYVWASSGIQLVFHVATMMPTSRERDPQCIGKKRHIGNDFVKVIYNDSGRPFRSDMLPGQFNFVDIVVEPQTPAGKSWTARGMSSNTGFFKVSMQRRTGMPEIGPLGVFKMVSDKCLGDCVRQLALHANIFAQGMCMFSHATLTLS